ncbi:30S ribosomal protein S21 [subsurface metagenome]
MAKIEVREHESIEEALRRFKRALQKSGILSEAKKRRHYEKPSEKRRRKKIEAEKRRRKRLARARRDRRERGRGRRGGGGGRR